MKHYFIRPILIFIAVLVGSNSLAGDLQVARMTCDYRTNPLGVDAATPQLSWRFESNERGQKQTAYQVLVASSLKLLAKSEGDLWDSGKVESDENTGVIYGGKPLASRRQCFWQVRVWDVAGKTSAWCSPATWTMGVLGPDAWNAKWISSPTNQYFPGPAVYLQKQIAVPKKVNRAIARYSALGWVELTVDGRNVGDAVLSPEFSDLNQRVLYVAHDVTALLSQGGHTLEAVLGNGQHSPVERIGVDEVDKIVVPGGQGGGYHNRWGRFGGPKFLLELEVAYADGSRKFFGTDQSWQWSSGPITYNDIWRGEKQNLRVAPTNWNDVAVFSAPPGRMEVSAIPPVRKLERLAPSRIEGDKIYFDTVAAGWPRLVVRGQAGQKITITGKVGSEFNLPPLEFTLRGTGTEVTRRRWRKHWCIEPARFPWLGHADERRRIQGKLARRTRDDAVARRPGRRVALPVHPWHSFRSGRTGIQARHHQTRNCRRPDVGERQLRFRARENLFRVGKARREIQSAR
jgi:alpha-L-rhamnosidase